VGKFGLDWFKLFQKVNKINKRIESYILIYTSKKHKERYVIRSISTSQSVYLVVEMLF